MVGRSYELCFVLIVRQGRGKAENIFFVFHVTKQSRVRSCLAMPYYTLLAVVLAFESRLWCLFFLRDIIPPPKVRERELAKKKRLILTSSANEGKTNCEGEGKTPAIYLRSRGLSRQPPSVITSYNLLRHELKSKINCTAAPTNGIGVLFPSVPIFRVGWAVALYLVR